MSQKVLMLSCDSCVLLVEMNCSSAVDLEGDSRLWRPSVSYIDPNLANWAGVMNLSDICWRHGQNCGSDKGTVHMMSQHMVVLWPQASVGQLQANKLYCAQRVRRGSFGFFNGGCDVSDIMLSYPEAACVIEISDLWVCAAFLYQKYYSILPSSQTQVLKTFLFCSALILDLSIQTKSLCYSRAWFFQVSLLPSVLTRHIEKRTWHRKYCVCW